MAIMKITRLGHPVLREKAKRVDESEITTPEFRKLIEDMTDTMRDADGVGIAAPQVGVSKQIALCEVRKNPRYPKAPDLPLTVLINPEIESHSEAFETEWEGCLSIPDMRGVVPRYDALVCRALNLEGEEVRLKATGFFARIIQHEHDHLNGLVYPDRMPDLKTLSHLKEFEEYWNR